MLSLVAFLQVLAPAQPTPSTTPPNILIVVLDDVGTDLVGCYANEHANLALEACTPRIDALAAEGMRFTNVWSNPVCSPSRGLLLTGKPARATGVGTITLESSPSNSNFGLQVGEPTIASALEDYASAAVGKWHVSDMNQDLSGAQHPLALGFDSFAGTMYGMTDYNDWTKTVMPPGTQIHHYNVYSTTDTADDALALIPSLQEPWLLHVGFFSTHWPYHCPQESGFEAQDCQSSPCTQDWCQDCSSLVAGGECQALGVDACYGRAMTHALDAKVGELLDAVDAQDTAVILTSDNGTVKRGIVAPFDPTHSKGTLYQGGIQVPLIIRAPGAASGVNHDLVSLTDLFATVTDLAGVVPPPSPGRDSVSLHPVLYPDADRHGASRRRVYAEWFDSNFVPEPGSGPSAQYVSRFHHRALRNATHKVIDVHGWDSDVGQCASSFQFFQLADHAGQDPAAGPDPYEQVDLMQSAGSWSDQTQAAFDDLVGALEEHYPRFASACP